MATASRHAASGSIQPSVVVSRKCKQRASGWALVASIDDGGGPIPIGVVTGMVVFTGIGAAAGAGIDALITRRQVIYEKPGGWGHVSISPLFLDGRRGVAVSVQF